MALFLRGELAEEEERECMGIEPPANTPKNSAFPGQGGADSGAVAAQIDNRDPDLTRLLAAWPSLSTAIRRAVLALIESAD
jgi:hypothetical protein